MIEPGIRLDPAVWGPYVVVKPTLGGRGDDVRIRKTGRVRYEPPESFPPEHRIRKGPLIAQRFVYTGPWAVSYRVCTFFGRALYCWRVEQSHQKRRLESRWQFAGTRRRRRHPDHRAVDDLDLHPGRRRGGDRARRAGASARLSGLPLSGRRPAARRGIRRALGHRGEYGRRRLAPVVGIGHRHPARPRNRPLRPVRRPRPRGRAAGRDHPPARHGGAHRQAPVALQGLADEGGAAGCAGAPRARAPRRVGGARSPWGGRCRRTSRSSAAPSRATIRSISTTGTPCSRASSVSTQRWGRLSWYAGWISTRSTPRARSICTSSPSSASAVRVRHAAQRVRIRHVGERIGPGGSDRPPRPEAICQGMRSLSAGSYSGEPSSRYTRSRLLERRRQRARRSQQHADPEPAVEVALLEQHDQRAEAAAHRGQLAVGASQPQRLSVAGPVVGRQEIVHLVEEEHQVGLERQAVALQPLHALVRGVRADPAVPDLDASPERRVRVQKLLQQVRVVLRRFQLVAERRRLAEREDPEDAAEASPGSERGRAGRRRSSARGSSATGGPGSGGTARRAPGRAARARAMPSASARASRSGISEFARRASSSSSPRKNTSEPAASASPASRLRTRCDTVSAPGSAAPRVGSLPGEPLEGLHSRSGSGGARVGIADPRGRTGLARLSDARAVGARGLRADARVRLHQLRRPRIRGGQSVGPARAQLGRAPLGVHHLLLSRTGSRSPGSP